MERKNIEFDKSKCSYFENPILKRKFAEIKSPTPEDFQSDCHVAHVSESESKKPKLSRTDDNLHLICKWKECVFETNVIEMFIMHVAHHIPAPQGKIKSVKDGKQALAYACLWDGCPFKSNVLNDIYKHVNYHSYHTKLIAIGVNVRGRVKLPNCHREQSSKKVIESLQSIDQICEWNGCDETFNVYQLYLSHVDMHTKFGQVIRHSRKKGYRCKWTGCKMGFTRLRTLRSHMRTHTKEKSVACPDCRATFCSNTKFISHCKCQGTSDWNEDKAGSMEKFDEVVLSGRQTRSCAAMRRGMRSKEAEDPPKRGMEFEISTSEEYYSSCEIDGEIVPEGDDNFQEFEIDPLEEINSQEIKSEDTTTTVSPLQIDKEMKKECGAELFIEKVFCIQDQESQLMDLEPQLQNQLHAAVEDIIFQKTKTIQQIDAVVIDPVLSSEVHNSNRIQNGILKLTDNSNSSLTLCRLCANPSNDMIHIFGENGISENIIRKIEYCLPIVVKKTDTLTKQACRSCVEKLECLYEFYVTVSKAEEKLLILDKKTSDELEGTEIQSENFSLSDEQSSDIEYDNIEAKRQIFSHEHANNNGLTNMFDQREQMADRRLENHVLLSNPKNCSNELLSTNDNLPNGKSRTGSLHASDEYLTADSPIDSINSSERLLSQNEESKHLKGELNHGEKIFLSEDNSSSFTGSCQAFNSVRKKVRDDCDKFKGVSIDRNIPCSDCGEGFEEESDGVVHKAQDHGAERSYSCGCCHKNLITQSERDYHQRVTRCKLPFESSEYEESSATARTLKKCSFTLSNGEKRTLSCFICDKSFESSETRDQHMAELHTYA